jgi:hypothetical protein
MYDGNFGGIEQMTKRFTIALVTLVLLVLATVVPVSAYWDPDRAFYVVAPYINQGATVFIGEQNLDITGAIWDAQNDNEGFGLTVIGWWGYDADIETTSATRMVETADIAEDFWINQEEFDGYEGNWYLVGQNGFAASDAVFNVQHPTLSLSIRDPDLLQGADVTGKSVPTGTPLEFRIGTNMYTVAANSHLRSNTSYWDDPEGTLGSNGYIDIAVKTESGAILNALCDDVNPDDECTNLETIKGQNVDAQPWHWGEWLTHAINPETGQRMYPAGTYVVYATSRLNNMQSNYLNNGAAYTGRTVTETKTITLVSDTVKITVNKDSVVRTNDFSVNFRLRVVFC